jgi:hypothetical protein
MPGLFMFLHFAVVIVVIIYMMLLFTRFVNAAEKIANSLENYCKNR